jgi:predicted 3-demethylubiquinone-9 3-methyltransferase (glyoxalase superfamily)
MDKVIPCLWFDGNVEEAARFYASTIPGTEIISIDRSPADTPSGPKDSVLTVNLRLAGHEVVLLNGGPDFKLDEAFSFQLMCEDQAEVDRYWDQLIEGGGEHSVCGWLKDRFGLSWQIVPRRLSELLTSSDRDAAGRAMQAMLDMTKLDIAELEAAFEGRGVSVG